MIKNTQNNQENIIEDDNLFLKRNIIKKDNKNYFQLNLKYLMRKYNLTQANIADKTGLSLSAIKSYTRNKDPKFPHIETQKKIAAVFNVPFEFLTTPNLEMMLQDQRVTQTLHKDYYEMELSKGLDYKHNFETALIEEGYNSILAFINYLQFIGYEISYYSRAQSIDSSFSIDLEKNWQQEKEKTEQEYEKCKNEAAGLAPLMDNKYNNLTEVLAPELAKHYTLLLIDISNYESYLNQLNDESLKKLSINQQLNFRDIIKTINKFGKFKHSEAIHRLSLLRITVHIFSSETNKTYKINLQDFYEMCHSYNQNIFEKITSLPFVD